MIAEFTRLIDQIGLVPRLRKACKTICSCVPDASIELLNGDGRLLASPFPSDDNQIGNVIQSSTVDQALNGEASSDD